MISNDIRPLFRDLDRVVRDLRRAGGVVQQPERHPRRVADAAHELAQVLADAAADASGLPHRPVPRIADSAVADQVAVIGRDLLEADTGTGAVDVARVHHAVREVRELMLRGVPR